jgi:hypothetical protein
MGLSGSKTTHLLKKMGILNQHGTSLRFNSNTFTDSLALLEDRYIEGIEVETSRVAPVDARSTRGGGSRKRQWFVRIGLLKGQVKVHKNASNQLAAGQNSPRVSLNLHRALFIGCLAADMALDEWEELDESKGSATTAATTSKQQTTNDLPPEVHVSTEDLQEEPTEAMTVQVADTFSANVGTNAAPAHANQTTTPYLDLLLANQDTKRDRPKMLGLLRDTFGVLTPSRSARTVELEAHNGQKQLLVMVPQCQEGGLDESERRTHWLSDIFKHTMSSVSKGATAVGRLIGRQHTNEFLLAGKLELGLEQSKVMDTYQCEAMIQDANLSFKRFVNVRKHVTHASGPAFKMVYLQADKRKLEMGARVSPEPTFGIYNDEDKNGEVEKCNHYSTNICEELTYATESHMLESTEPTNPRIAVFPQRELQVVVGLDHGQGALSRFAKFLLTPPELRKQMGNLSYGCPIVKICHVKCRTDSYRIIKNTVATHLNETMKTLKESKVVTISDLLMTKVQAVLVPQKAAICSRSQQVHCV